MIIRVAHGQTIEDIALQYYGAIEGLAYLFEDNSLSMDGDLYPGQEITIREDADAVTSTARRVVDFLQKEGVKPNSGIVGAAPDADYVEDDYWDDDYVE